MYTDIGIIKEKVLKFSKDNYFLQVSQDIWRLFPSMKNGLMEINSVSSWRLILVCVSILSLQAWNPDSSTCINSLLDECEKYNTALLNSVISNLQKVGMVQHTG